MVAPCRAAPGEKELVCAAPMSDSSLRRLKADHLKKRADQALREGDFRTAWERYSDAIDARPDKDGLAALHSNRSLAYAKAQRYRDALQDADAAVQLAPQWSKAHWRRAAALAGMKNTPQAVLAYLAAWRLAQPGSAERGECEAKLWQSVQRLTREQLGQGFIRLMKDLQQQGALRGADAEGVSEQEMEEAWFRVVKAAHQGQPRPGPLYARYLRCLRDGLAPAEAYALRATAHSAAKCYLQARSDAGEAVAMYSAALAAAAAEGGHGGGGGEAERARLELGDAYLRLGQALLAEPDHEDRDCLEAFKALTRGTEFDPDSQALRDLVQEASEGLTTEQLERAAVEIYNEGAPGAAHPGAPGERPLRPGERLFRVEVSLAFPSARPADVNSRAREVLRRALAAAAGVNETAATLEGVLPARPPGRPCLVVRINVAVGPRLLQGNALVHAVHDESQLLAAAGGAEMAQLLGAPDVERSAAELVDVTPACMDSEAQRAQRAAQDHEGAEVAPGAERRLALPSRPKLDLEVPYRLYRLVTADGRPLARADKHPFCMSRVYYDAADTPAEEAWAELADGSCRWRQTASEVRVQALGVPRALPARDLAVSIQPYSLRIAHARTGEVYLDGRLERGVVPEECWWTACPEEGVALSLRKMNLEVLRRQWAHAESWWPRLFGHHAELAWDDYEKDYSDLPEEVMGRHRVAEAIKEAERQAEAGERGKREALQEADDLRKRARQERLGELRTGARRDWVALHRDNPGAA